VIFLTRLPDRLLLVLLSIFVACFSTAAFSVYHPFTVLPLALVLIVVSWRFVPTDVVPTRAHVWGSIIALVAVAVWVAMQVPFATEFLVPSRDPGLYTNMAASLATTGHSAIDISDAVQDAAGISQASPDLGNFSAAADGMIRLQGGSALPSMVALGYWFGGITGLTAANSVIGGFMLIGLYSLGRRLLGPLWALLPPLLIGISMPMVFFSRAPYTEALSGTVFFGAVIWLWSAFTTGRRSEFVLAGAFAGAAAMTRVDATLGEAALIGAFVLILLGISRPRATVPLVTSFVAYLVPAVLLTLLAIFDLQTNFANYLIGLRGKAGSLWELLAVVIVGALVVILVRWQIAGRSAEEPLGRPLGDRGARVLGLVVAILTPVLFAYWAIRPLFVHFAFGNIAGVSKFIEAMQTRYKLPINGQQTFDEYSLDWLVWYFGPVFVVAACIGVAVLGYRAIVRRRPGLLAFWLVTMGLGLLYFNEISISPDQPWAFRRLLPTIAPGFAVAVAWVVRWLATSGRMPRFATGARRVPGIVLAAVAVVGVVGGTATTWTPALFRSTEQSNQVAELRTTCAQLGSAKQVVLVDAGPSAYAMPLHTFCGLEVVSVRTGTLPASTEAEKAAVRVTTQATLAQLEQRLDQGTPVILFDPDLVTWQDSAPAPLQTIAVTSWTKTLLSAPKEISTFTRSTYVGAMTPTGLVTAKR